MLNFLSRVRKQGNNIKRSSGGLLHFTSRKRPRLERRSSRPGPSFTAVMEVSGLLPGLCCSLGFIHAAAEPHFHKGVTYLGVDWGYFGRPTLPGGLAVPQSNRCLTTLLCQQSAASVRPLSLCADQSYVCLSPPLIQPPLFRTN